MVVKVQLKSQRIVQERPLRQSSQKTFRQGLRKRTELSSILPGRTEFGQRGRFRGCKVLGFSQSFEYERSMAVSQDLRGGLGAWAFGRIEQHSLFALKVDKSTVRAFGLGT